MSDFQFLRPLWLFVLLLVPVLIYLMRRGDSGASQWHRVIPQALLNPLMPATTGGPGTTRRYRLLAPVLLGFAAVALAGPSFRSAPSPLQQQDDSLVVVLDLSLSMLATDVEPDRLTRATRKIRDLLAAREGALTGLVVYAADGHVVTPLTDDRRTVEGMLEALDPVIMPAAGNRADLGVARAAELLKQGAPGRGRILLITDGLNPRYADRIRSQLATTPWQLNGLLVGTENGAPIPLPERGFIRDGDRVVIARASLEELEQTARATGGDALSATTSDRDISRLGLRAQDHDRWQETSDERMAERRQDDGYWLLWLVLPLALLGWRKGALAMVACTLWWVPAGPAQALGWEDLWQTPEQRAPQLVEQDPAKAARKLNDPLWRGTALYRDGQYEGAADAFARADTADAHYNRGNALARAGKPQAALEAWDQALTRDPDHEDARHNRQTLQEYLEQQEQDQQQSERHSGNDEQQGDSRAQENGSQQQQGQQNGDQTGSQDQPEGGGEPSQASPDSKEQGPGAGRDQENAGQERDGQEGQPEQQQQADATADGMPDEQTTDANGGSGQEQQADALTQSQEQWLRRIPDDPGGLLRRKFLQQSRSRNVQPDENDTPW